MSILKQYAKKLLGKQVPADYCGVLLPSKCAITLGCLSYIEAKNCLNDDRYCSSQGFQVIVTVYSQFTGPTSAYSRYTPHTMNNYILAMHVVRCLKSIMLSGESKHAQTIAMSEVKSLGQRVEKRVVGWKHESCIDAIRLIDIWFLFEADFYGTMPYSGLLTLHTFG
jgi:hypothetical protein